MYLSMYQQYMDYGGYINLRIWLPILQILPNKVLLLSVSK
jgi:hypothetical protein